MGVFRRWGEEWRRFERMAATPLLPVAIDRWTERWGQQLRNEAPALRRVVRARLPPRERILTISRSSSVLAALLAPSRSRRPQEVVVLESRPGGEGRLFADDLRVRGLRVRLVSDPDAPRWLDEVDRVVIGADAILADGSVVHKVGTRALALGARRRGVPVVVVSGRSKVVPSARRPSSLPRLFDVTPASAISEYWTDGGVVKRRASIRSVFPSRGSRLFPRAK